MVRLCISFLCFQVLVEKMGLPEGSHGSTSCNELLGMSELGLFYIFYHLQLILVLKWLLSMLTLSFCV